MAEDAREAKRRFAPILVALGVVAALALFFGRACLPGNWIADRTPGADSYFLATIYERWAVQVGGGHLPLWFPEFGAGFPVHAAWMYGLAYPPLAAFLVLPAETAWVWLSILHAAFGAAGMFLFLRDEEHRDAAAATGAIVFALSGFMVGRVSGGHLNLLMPMAWAPWVLLWTGRCVRGGRRDAAVLGVVAGIGLLAGHVQIWFYAGPLVVAFAVIEMKRRDAFRSALPRLGIAAAIAIGVSAIQWMPALELVSVGGTLDADERTMTLGSARISDLAAQFWPSWLTDDVSPMRHEYLGLAGPLAVLALPLSAFAPRRGRGLWLGAAVAGLLLATGTHNAIGRALNEVPPFSLGRVPARGLVIVVLAAAPLAANLVSARWRAPGWIAPVVFGVSALATMTPAESVQADFYYFDWTDKLPPSADGHRVHVAYGRYPLLERFGIRTLRDVCPVTTPGYRKLIELSEKPTAWWFDVGAQIAVPWKDEPPADRAATEALARAAAVDRFASGGRAQLFRDAPSHDDEGMVFGRMDRGERVLFLTNFPERLEGPWFAALDDQVRELPAASPAELSFEIRSERGFRAVRVSESWYPGWQWRQHDGAWVPADCANGAFLAAYVTAMGGVERIDFRYAPGWLVPSAGLCASALAAAALLLLRSRNSRPAEAIAARPEYPRERDSP